MRVQSVRRAELEDTRSRFSQQRNSAGHDHANPRARLFMQISDPGRSAISRMSSRGSGCRLAIVLAGASPEKSVQRSPRPPGRLDRKTGLV